MAQIGFVGGVAGSLTAAGLTRGIIGKMCWEIVEEKVPIFKGVSLGN